MLLFFPNPRNVHFNGEISPLKLFDYMASNRPIVAARLPTITPFIEDGIGGLLFEPENSADLAEKIEFVLTRDCSSLARHARSRVEDYTWQRRAERIVGFMSEVPTVHCRQ